jgi:hypothetical protein
VQVDAGVIVIEAFRNINQFGTVSRRSSEATVPSSRGNHAGRGLGCRRIGFGGADQPAKRVRREYTFRKVFPRGAFAARPPAAREGSERVNKLATQSIQQRSSHGSAACRAGRLCVLGGTKQTLLRLRCCRHLLDPSSNLNYDRGTCTKPEPANCYSPEPMKFSTFGVRT